MTSVHQQALRSSSPLWLFIRARHGLPVLTAGALVTAVTCAIGLREIPIGVTHGIPQGAPLWAYSGIAVAAALAMTYQGEFARQEAVGSRVVGRANLAYLLGALVLLSVVTFASVWVSNQVGISEVPSEALGTFALATIRNLLGWTGLSLIAGRFFGALLSWSVPLASVLVFEWLGRDPNGDPYWWTFPIQPTASVPAWSVCLGLLGVGLIAAWPARNLTSQSERFVRG